MAFNIKNESTVDGLREIAAQTGESMSQAADRAVSERLARLEKRSRFERVMEISNACAGEEPEEWRGLSANELINELLYDEQGLPK